MNNESMLLTLSALSIGFIHTVVGPDHYLPFIMLSRSQKWSYKKTLLITLGCGLGHILSSIVIGIIGIGAGLALTKVQTLEGTRGDIASYLLLAFGLSYMIWGIKKGLKHKKHTHAHNHPDGTSHDHNHNHIKEHTHLHGKAESSIWWLFIIFVLGPCEPLIPLFMYPAAKKSLAGVFMVTMAFGLATILTMAILVSIAFFGLKQLRFAFLERYAHALGGAIISLSAGAIIFLGL